MNESKTEKEPRSSEFENMLAILLLPPSRESVEHMLLKALLQHHSCGQLIRVMADIQARAGNHECAEVLTTIVEMREGMAYTFKEPDKTGLRVGKPSIRNNALSGVDVVVL